MQVHGYWSFHMTRGQKLVFVESARLLWQRGGRMRLASEVILLDMGEIECAKAK